MLVARRLVSALYQQQLYFGKCLRFLVSWRFRGQTRLKEIYLLDRRLEWCVLASQILATWAGGPSRTDTSNPTREIKKEREKDEGKDRFKYRFTAGKIRTVARHPAYLIGGLTKHMQLTI